MVYIKKENKVKLFLIILLLPINLTIAQTENPLDFFPFKTGNVQEYLYSDGPMYRDTIQVFTVFDSTDIEGNIYLKQTGRFINPTNPPVLFSEKMDYMIDTLFQVWGTVGEIQNTIAFKLNANKGEQWVLDTYYNSKNESVAYEMARIEVIRNIYLFGDSVQIMGVHYYYANDSTDTTGLDRAGYTLAKGFGVYGIGGGDAPGSAILKGAVIDGMLYGDTTQVITSIRDLNNEALLNNFSLQQNYPNPFNAGTTIEFFLDRQVEVTLIIYDILGREVTHLIDNEYCPNGVNKIFWDGTSTSLGELPSGVYLYTLRVDNNHIKTKSMILLK